MNLFMVEQKNKTGVNICHSNCLTPYLQHIRTVHALHAQQKECNFTALNKYAKEMSFYIIIKKCTAHTIDKVYNTLYTYKPNQNNRFHV